MITSVSDTSILINDFKGSGFNGSEVQWFSSEVQRFRGLEVQRFRSSEVQRFRSSEKKFRGSEVQRFRGLEVDGLFVVCRCRCFRSSEKSLKTFQDYQCL
jgi:hypothetical protein